MADRGELDAGAYADFEAAHNRIADKWVGGAMDVLQARNPALLHEFERVQSVIDSLLVIPHKPAALRKQWKETLDLYEKIADQCVVYAKRHMTIAEVEDKRAKAQGAVNVPS